MQDNTRFEGRVAIVTGAGSRDPGAGATTVGNGRAIATLLARRGARVMLLDIEREWLRGTEAMIREEGGTCAAAVCDVAKDADCAAAVAAAVRAFGRVDILVNNVGISGPPGDATTVDPEAWDHGMQVNVKSVMLMARHAVPEMRRQGAGAIVNLASIAGLMGGHPGLLYATTKGAIVQMTRAMAAHHGGDLIRVNAVAPGYVYTPMVASRGMSEELRQQRATAGLLKVEGTAWDVAEAVCFLASPAARWITGVTLPVDAGRSAGNVGATPQPLGLAR
ncbi:glucose 1-dehydrogenase [Roseomonas alkaliterrae]|uniref:NAD(P)-dependent dehydrogenase (Short-subunit alcohol dehydrogenase family) n=1 Tax=Neoroseomonas alkaliterrae TaxID=1452450 RepID=A0A840XWQ7_9PROT|nr:glucose 1-dehydrogenase [Neoroseomonas alkaliterrae]MBB5691610.1 NAD(P)-dependent dehydrogenase (short-subunit alcohol dehydrogenase family) [Neoroseomonas alkaliterrae]MBR0676960.1 glucose 1-dehydrogenase [Neoroseomonas alkaliterrae]